MSKNNKRSKRAKRYSKRHNKLIKKEKKPAPFIPYAVPLIEEETVIVDIVISENCF